MINREIIIKRLALIKQLYLIGIEQSKHVETIAAFSILSFHDSIEMFLKLVAENFDIKSDKFSFSDYWDSIPNLTLKESMKNLNARRVNIKHKGLLPSKSDIEISRVNTTDFFEQNIIIQTGIDFKDISLLTLISYEKTRNYLEEAQKSLDLKDFETCINKTAIAFGDLLYSYERSKSNYYGDSLFNFGKNLPKKIMGNELVNSIESIQKAIKIISLGIDYKRFVKFKLLTPDTVRTSDDQILVSGHCKNKKWSKENCQYCLDFVFDCTLKFQEFDFQLEELVEI